MSLEGLNYLCFNTLLLFNGCNKNINNTFIASLLVLLLIAGVGVWGLRKVETEIKANLQSHITESLNSTILLVQYWINDQKLDIETNAIESEIKRTLKMGFAQYLTKPIVLDQFLEMMNRYLGPSTSLLNNEPTDSKKPLDE